MEKKINLENYEAYLLDLAEGNLSYAEEKALIQFLAKHPELEVDLEELPVLDEESFSLDHSFKSALLRNEGSGLSEKDHLMISSVEGDLSFEEEDSLNALLKEDEHAQKELAYYQKTKLQAEEIAYPFKDQLLKKESRVIPLWTTISSIAAAILLMIYFGLPKENTYSPREFSYQPSPVEVETNGFAFVISDEEETTEDESQQLNKAQLSQSGGDNFFAQVEEDPMEEKKDDQVKEIEDKPAPIEIEPLNNKAMAELDGGIDQSEKSPIESEEISNEEEIADLPTEDSSENEKKAEETEVLTPLEYARTMIKKDVLKNRSLAESVKQEVENITNKKVNFEQAEDESEAQFALNIGKLQFRKK